MILFISHAHLPLDNNYLYSDWALAYWRRVLGLHASVAAFFIGIIVGVASLAWLLMLLILLVSSFAATKFKYEYKKKLNVAEGMGGERKLKNVLANGVVPVLIASLTYACRCSHTFATILFLSAISVAATDTLASEIGMLSDNVYLITNLKRKVRVGANGGVSLLGMGAAFFASLYVALIGALVCSIYSLLALIPLIVGFIGCQIDSLLGTTLEQHGVLTKGMVNVISIGCGVLIWIRLWIVFC